MESNDEERFYHGPYKLTYFEPWNGFFGTEALTDLGALNEDLERWKRLIESGDGRRVAAEIGEVLIAFQQPTPRDKLLAGNYKRESQASS